MTIDNVPTELGLTLFFLSPNADVLHHPSATANAQVLEGISILIPRQKIDL
jgi:hypothetical protein